MRVCHTVREVRDFVRAARAEGLVGLVPTMGYFHDGHLALMHRARSECRTVVVSIYVNPLQFGPREDFRSYPRDPERDLRLAEGAGVDMVFMPDDGEMYPPGYATYVEVEGLTDKLCGRSRPGHFRGVATVVTKLFNIVRPDRAYFGEKDFQQALVIRRLAADLNLDLEIITVPTVREPDGLAMSSRNVYLSPAEREAATVLYRSLVKARDAILAGERTPERVRHILAATIAAEPLADLDYAEVYGLPWLAGLDRLEGEVLLAVAARVGRARLIDNLVVKVPPAEE
ncbi:MAG: Pantothenate synthetase [Clostridia bacterium 62_21]|nr:MAG: Pantothenate synthetase [Clostridia bacterium 62_21]HAG07039.1 pantoate--beta-alanine ligase [Peptococcaceae bacterium]